MKSLQSRLARYLHVSVVLIFSASAFLAGRGVHAASALASGPVHDVVEIDFQGPSFGPRDRPAYEVDFQVLFRHEGTGREHRLHGFWDGDGRGGASGNVFKVRFCPTESGRWVLAEVRSNRRELDGQRQGSFIEAEPSDLKGFWTGGGRDNRWFQRDDGSFPFIVGNTHYVFLSRPDGVEASAETIRSDIEVNVPYFNKIRTTLKAFREPNGSEEAPAFFTPDGEPSNDEGGEESEVRVNPGFYFHRVDVAVQHGFEHDIIIDLILGSTAHNPEKMARTRTYLRYMAARYGAYPNVWFTLANEYSDQYTPAEVKERGEYLRSILPYPTPVSVHDWRGPWKAGLNGDWASHTIRQGKFGRRETRTMGLSADALIVDYATHPNKPVINDENGYYGEEATDDDIMAGVLGSFAGGGYGTTGYRTTAMTQGPYYWGFTIPGVDIADRPIVHRLKYFRELIEEHVRFWEMEPVGTPDHSIFRSAHEEFRVIEWAGNQYVLAADQAHEGILAELPEGAAWDVIQWDLIERQKRVLASGIRGSFTFATPDSRASMTLVTRREER